MKIVRLLLPSSLAMLAVASFPVPVAAQSAAARVNFNFAASAESGYFGGPLAGDDSSSLASSSNMDAPRTAARPQTSTEARALALAGVQIEPAGRPFNRPFRSLSVTANVGTSGIGFDLATPIAPRLKIRTGAQFFNQGVAFTTDGLNSDASITLRNVALMLDVFPFHNGFHLSPGVTLNNNNHIADMVKVPGGQSFTLGNTDYTSSVNDPINGIARIRFGNKVAPRFTLGWEDVLRHKAGHFSLPIEFGVQYSAAPVFTLSLAGTACNAQGCSPISSYSTSSDTQQEIIKVQNDLRPLRFYPITSTGVRYTFGR